MLKKYFLFTLIIFSAAISYAQKTAATISGKILNEEDKPLANATVQILGQQKFTTTNDSGFFVISVPSNKALALVFTHTGYSDVQKNFYISSGEKENITIKMEPLVKQLQQVIVKDEKQRQQAGLINIDASRALLNPSPISSIESLIKIFVGSNNELTSQYSVRGGSYDENLIYVNDFEVYRPFLVRSGQQEGLSFINPELTSNVKFYNGGFQAKYGDKMSSVLDVSYRKPVSNGGSVYLGLLEQGLHLEGISKDKRVTYLLGMRNRSNKSLLSTQTTQGNYIPSSSDMQGLLGFQVSDKLKLEALGNFSGTKFTLFPQQAQLTSTVFSPTFTGSVGLDIFYEGSEKSKYNTSFIGLSAIHQPNKKMSLKWMLSYYNDDEEENIDEAGTYLFGERNFDPNGSGPGEITSPLGAGIDQNYARNKLKIDIYNASHKGSYNAGKHFLQWGSSIEKQKVNDVLKEFEYQDSAGYSLPLNPSQLSLFSSINGTADLNITRLSGYVQDNIQFKDSSDFTLQAGIRYNYNSLNKEFLLSPRIGFSFKPKNWEKDIVLRGSAGIYNQPPFYREMRRYDGSLNTNVKAQKSWQASGGFDYNLIMWGRPGRITTEAYYKNMRDVIPYDIDNVRLRYYGENNAKAYSAGIETRIVGEFVKDAESWVSLGIMKTKEDLNNDYYTNYYNAAGELITAQTADKKVSDSATNAVGYLRRPTDRLITFGLFFQDYLSTNKNFKVYFNMLYGSNLPFNIPGSVRYRNALIIDPYLRADMGFSALLLDEDKTKRRSHSPFRSFQTIWASFEIFNIIDRANTISYQLVKDFDNNTYALPNRLTPRLLNFKIAARW